MSWVGRRMDHLGSAVFGAGGGLTMSQAPAFTQAYLQRLGGHIDEARRTIEEIASGRVLAWMGEEERLQAVAELTQRLEALQAMREQLISTPAMLRPAAMLRYADWSVARRAAEDFVPAVPLDPSSLVWTGVGIVLAVLAYECCKVPAWWARRRRERAGDAAT
ncbi:MAG: DUF2937 family protein [Wenzhouxiangellaceae bacterium]|nr:DUF2937 family protein [Wenzhouxiangellaceae bacterium]